MEIVQAFVTGFVLCISLCLDIGIVNTAIINVAIRNGFRSSFLIGLGSCVGDILYAFLSFMGIGILFSIPYVKMIIWAGGNMLLIGILISLLMKVRSEADFSAHPDRIDKAGTRYFRTGILLSLSSPTSILWFASIGGSLIAVQNQHNSFHLTLIFFSGFSLAGIFWSLGLSYSISKIRTVFNNSVNTVLNLISILLLACLCVYSICMGILDIFRK